MGSICSKIKKVVHFVDRHFQREKDNIEPQDMKEMALNSKNKNHGFKEVLKKSGLSVISEVKKASPSKGVIAEDKGFDRQFQAIPDAIKKKAIRTYKINTGIMLKISDIGNENDISAYEDAYGKKYLKIRLSDDRTFQTFARNNEDNREE